MKNPELLMILLPYGFIGLLLILSELKGENISLGIQIFLSTTAILSAIFVMGYRIINNHKEE